MQQCSAQEGLPPVGPRGARGASGVASPFLTLVLWMLSKNTPKCIHRIIFYRDEGLLAENGMVLVAQSNCQGQTDEWVGLAAGKLLVPCWILRAINFTCKPTTNIPIGFAFFAMINIAQ